MSIPCHSIWGGTPAPSHHRCTPGRCPQVCRRRVRSDRLRTAMAAAVARIRLDHLRHNLAAIRACVPRATRVCFVVKADAYGHGAVRAARAASAADGADLLAVSSVDEGRELREAGIHGQVLLLGVGHDADTTIHLAENEVGVRYRRAVHVTVLERGRPVRFDYTEIDHCCARFALVDDWLEADRLQRRGPVAHGVGRLARARDIVRVVTARLRENETVFLHPRGSDVECDEAWASLGRTAP